MRGVGKLQKLIIIVNGDSSAVYQLNKYFEEGWHVKEMKTESTEETAICYVLIEREC